MANNSLLQSATQLGLGVDQRAANIMNGMQLGVGYNLGNIDAATPLTFNPTTFVVLAVPRMYSLRSEDRDFGRALKSLIETHMKTITGVDFGYTLDTEEQPFGHDGQNIAVPTKAKRTAVSPSMTFAEVPGNLGQNLFTRWLQDIQHPDTNAAMQRFQDSDIDFVSSAYSMTMIGIQHDMTQRADKIIKAALYLNMFPTNPGGTIGFERQIGQVKVMERTVEFGNTLVFENDAVYAIGQKIAGELAVARAMYENPPITPSVVSSNLVTSGLQAEADELINSIS